MAAKKKTAPKKFVSPRFHRGAGIPGRHPRLDGDAALVRSMRFADEAEVKAGRKDIQKVVKAWCDSR